ncbi:hypothetical protein M408DRAFT_13787 [Serendipita vermifera MAFF 305830]|uniref:Calponin-homology (CH) domain-containing protein n=1 Tax=Serendipita vermifera MAFF 305830 TaxID=933852 RepID=A0A0C3BBJ9_SERVB|nr:hypothetical protein M408DRAFT_13787 [Serendipita vermifera MAFF 305830]
MSHYRPTLLRRDSVSNRWTDQVKDSAPSSSGRPGTITLPTATTSRHASDPATQTKALGIKFPDLAKEDLTDLINQFHAIPSSKAGWITQSTALNASQKFENYTYNRARETMKKVHADATNAVDLEDWVEFAVLMRSGRPPTMTPGKRSGTSQMRGSGADTSHTIDDQGERVEYTEYINSALASDPDVSARLPIPTDTMQIFDECRDGIIICKLVEHFYPGTIDTVMGVRRRRGTTFINLPSGKDPLNKFQMAENNNIAILCAQEIGANVVNINAQDLMQGREHLVLALIGQIIRLGKSDKPRPPSRRATMPAQSRSTTPIQGRPTTPSHPRRSSTIPVRPVQPTPIRLRARSASLSMSVDEHDDEITRVASPLSANRPEPSTHKERHNHSELRSKLRERGTFKLFEDLKGGMIILEALDKVSPTTATGSVPVALQTRSRPSTPSTRRTEPVPKAKRPPSPPALRRADSVSKAKRPSSPPVVKEAPVPAPAPAIAKGSPPMPKGGLGLGIDEGIIAQRRALLFSITSRA